jgi:hypothetical protein
MTMLGLKHSPKTIEKMKLKARRNEASNMWKGNKASLPAIHIWVKKRLVKPKFCSDCFKNPVYDLANISQKYRRNLTDWEWLCRKCHMTKDGRLQRLKKRMSERIINQQRNNKGQFAKSVKYLIG